MNEPIFTKPLSVPDEGKKVYTLSPDELEAIFARRAFRDELDPGMGGASPKKLDGLLESGSKLVSVDLALTSACNFKCEWCYRPGEEWGKLLLKFDTITKVVEQSADLGVKYFVLTGGEPTMYFDKEANKRFFDVVDFIQDTYESRGLSAKVLTFSDVALISPERAQQFADRGVALCLKRDTLDHDMQNLIVGSNFGVVRGSEKMVVGYENLFNAGYGTDPKLAVSVNTVLGVNIPTSEDGETINTLTGAVDLHYWVKEHGLHHSIVPVHYCGVVEGANQTAGIHPLQIKALYDVLAAIDDLEFNDPWIAHSAFPNDKTCNRPGRGVHVRATGKVTSCSESPLTDAYVFGNINETPLTEIVSSQKFQDFRREFSKREGKYICNPNVCDLNAESLCRGGCAVRSAYSQINPTTGLIEQNTKMEAYSQGREDSLCPGWVVLAQKQGALKEGIYEGLVDQLLSESVRLTPEIKERVRDKVVTEFTALRNTH